ncbi:hypothetical protein JJV70_19215 [Streptomyces sp. JJ66]|uniref:hypothetical protein n=1 Tax=Streptomyces sp. JJ66 TaxID=2803843 RepID=UPI001C58F63F|nr:hypothetical protein [Streptomyces sp. JJ66]MBW1604190.1 hypothetical protein [Streptomyces sp. JJ66]
MTPALAAIPILLLVTFCYLALCAASPYGDCRKCNGIGFALRTDRRGTPKRGRVCRRCRGHGKRVRIGRAAFNHTHRLYRDGTH